MVHTNVEYQELELGMVKKLSTKVASRCGCTGGIISNWQTVINVGFLVAIVGLTAALSYHHYQIRLLGWHLNATHIRVHELEMWQKHMCAIRHYNCPAERETPEYPDDWDWDNFPSMDDYAYDNPFNDHFERRRKREVVAETSDGVPIDPQPYAIAKRRNETKRAGKKVPASPEETLSAGAVPVVPITQAEFHSPAWEQPTHKIELTLYDQLEGETVTTRPATPRPHTDSNSNNERRPTVMTKSLDTHYQNPQSAENYPQHDRRPDRRRPPYRQRLMEDFDEEPPYRPAPAPVIATVLKPTRRHVPAAQYNGDTSKYVLGFHQNYYGNGHMKHLERTYVDWAASDWMQQTNTDGVFDYNNGVLTINEDGLYFVYAQIFYVDDHDLNGYHVYKNSEMILQCTTMTHSTTRVKKSNTCYTAGVERFSAGDRLYVRDVSDDRYSLFEKGKSFFGALKLSDLRAK